MTMISRMFVALLLAAPARVLVQHPTWNDRSVLFDRKVERVLLIMWLRLVTLSILFGCRAPRPRRFFKDAWWCCAGSA